MMIFQSIIFITLFILIKKESKIGYNAIEFERAVF